MTPDGPRIPQEGGAIEGAIAPSDRPTRRGGAAGGRLPSRDIDGAMTDYAQLAEVYDCEMRGLIRCEARQFTCSRRSPAKHLPR